MAHKHAILTLLLLSASPAMASPGAGGARKPPPDSRVSRELLTLRVDLLKAGKDRALGDMPRFRPLCDRDGYPLVGNMASKGEHYQPSQFCAEVRKAGK